MVPIRAIIEELGGSIGWDAQERKVTLKLDSTTIDLWIDQTNTKVNGEDKITDVAPIEINGRTYLPVRFVAENLGCNVDWDEAKKMITIRNISGVAQLGIQFVQDGKKYDVKNETEEITLDKKEFSIRFEINESDEKNDQWFAAEIAALTDRDSWLSVQTGVNTWDDDTICFNPGMGLACYADKQYDSMIVQPNSFHYIAYGEDMRRARLLEKTKQNTLLLEWDIKNIYFEGEDYSITSSPLDVIYLAFYIDNDLDDIIDSGELAKVQLKLK